MREYDYMECCASGSCEVCSGAQGMVRQQVRREDAPVRFHDERHCPGCGRAGVVVGLNSVLIETRPVIRIHACGVGGPGSAEVI